MAPKSSRGNAGAAAAAAAPVRRSKRGNADPGLAEMQDDPEAQIRKATKKSRGGTKGRGGGHPGTGGLRPARGSQSEQDETQDEKPSEEAPAARAKSSSAAPLTTSARSNVLPGLGSLERNGTNGDTPQAQSGDTHHSGSAPSATDESDTHDAKRSKDKSDKGSPKHNRNDDNNDDDDEETDLKRPKTNNSEEAADNRTSTGASSETRKPGSGSSYGRDSQRTPETAPAADSSAPRLAPTSQQAGVAGDTALDTVKERYTAAHDDFERALRGAIGHTLLWNVPPGARRTPDRGDQNSNTLGYQSTYGPATDSDDQNGAQPGSTAPDTEDQANLLGSQGHDVDSTNSVYQPPATENADDDHSTEGSEPPSVPSANSDRSPSPEITNPTSPPVLTAGESENPNERAGLASADRELSWDGESPGSSSSEVDPQTDLTHQTESMATAGDDRCRELTNDDLDQDWKNLSDELFENY